jgi:hypothetical protein
MLVYISTVDGPRAMVPLLGYDPDVGLDLFDILVISPVIDLKIPDVNYKLGLNDINRYLSLVGDM